MSDPRKLDEVRRALWEYGQHKSFCRYTKPKYDDDFLPLTDGIPCDCGLHAALEASKEVGG